MKITRKILALLLLTFFLGGMFVSLFHLPSMMGGMDMSMEGDCPFMSHEETFCPMNFMEHIGAWKDIFIGLTPKFLASLLIVSFLIVAVSLAPNLLLQPRYFIPPLLGRVRECIYTFTYRFWQELFSGGILNPKLF